MDKERMCEGMNIEIANRLVKMRKEKGLSQEALAEQLGISRQAVSKWERAESSPDTSNLITLAQLYGVSLDVLLNTDQEKFESGAPIEQGETAASTQFDTDYVKVSWSGVHVKDGDNEVHVSWNGIQVIEDGKESVRIGLGAAGDSDLDGFGVHVAGHETYSWKMDGVLTLVVFGIWLWIGFEHALWHPGWLLFLIVPLVSSFVDAIKAKRADRFAFPVLIALIYGYLAFVAHMWHPTWLIFLTIPVYYTVVKKAREWKKKKTTDEV